MTTNLWVDRDTPPPYASDWVWARSSAEAIAALTGTEIGNMSLNYYLGHHDSALDIIVWLRRNMDRYPIGAVTTHSTSRGGKLMLEEELSYLEALRQE